MTCIGSIIEVQYWDIRVCSACASPPTSEHVNAFADIVFMVEMIPRGSKLSVESNIWWHPPDLFIPQKACLVMVLHVAIPPDTSSDH